MLLINGAIISISAVFFAPTYPLFFVTLMLFLPFLDRDTRNISLSIFSRQKLHNWLILLSITILILLINPEYFSSILGIIFITALPEEWFFRGYFQKKLLLLFEKKHGYKSAMISSNVTTSLLFTLLHIPAQGLIGLSIFLPSLILGWIYQVKGDIIYVILIHSLFNLFFIIYIRDILVA